MTYIFMVDTLHEHQLSVSAFSMSLILKRPAEFLYSHISLKVVVIRWAKREKEQMKRCGDYVTSLIRRGIWAIKRTRLFPEHPSQWVLDSDTASTLWMLNRPHLRCRILFLAYFCSWWSRCVSIRTRQTFTNLDRKNKTKSNMLSQLLWYLSHAISFFLAQQNKLKGQQRVVLNLFLALGFSAIKKKITRAYSC